MKTETPYRELLLRLFRAGVERVSASRALPAYLPRSRPQGASLVLGAGKAAAAMAAVAAQRLTGPVSGLVVTRYGHTSPVPLDAIEVIEAAHPVPDQKSRQAARQMLALARGAGPQDRLVFLASGGGSAVLCLPVPGLAFAEKQAVVRHFILSGAPISEINCVRKHLSAIKGGRLAAASGTSDIRTYIISDVPGDDPAAVASGPTVADPSTLAAARAVIARYGSPCQDKVMALLGDRAHETPKPGTLNERHVIIAKAADCLDAAAALARAEGWQVHNLGDHIEGEARILGAEHAKLARALKGRGGRWLMLSGGEATVTVRHPEGGGGPNLEYLAGLAQELNGEAGIYALAGDTDGIDGSEDNAGAIITPTTRRRAQAAGLDIKACLAQNQTYALFKTLDDLVVTGPTLTNVNDLRAIVIDGG